MNDICPQCEQREWIGVEYSLDNWRYHYDGVSEWVCKGCGYRKGRWCDEELKEHEVEPKFHTGGGIHPKLIKLDDENQRQGEED